MHEEVNIKDQEYLKRIEQITKKQFRKIYTNKQMGFQQKTIRRRNLATALAVCELVGELDFPKVAQYSLVLTEDLAVKKLATMYDSQVELANINPEKFVNGIDSFFNSVAVYIKKICIGNISNCIVSIKRG